ncbi:MAG: tetratricopeptide repeat protein [Candidatus Nitrohelix vancouverensis]|uniref:Tetratricopeptide repeat protein n=1 Tax=Candidatus Nitrohelix vancouverensis TaxID=2705534 RepID=A0A7T0G3Q5_9BACT|nr:MAG: tetratricopeptide repeat protein [Candidatus Nitrohelix vancouverensis]
MMFRTIFAIFLFSLVASTVSAQQLRATPDAVFKGHELVGDWAIEEADELAEALIKKYPSSGDAYFLKARVEFFKGNYEVAADIMKQVGGQHENVEEFRTLVNATHKISKRFVTRKSERFEFRYVDGPDAVLLPFAEEALEASYKILGDLLGFHPKEKIIVEIYPGQEPFSQVSPLTLKDIETSGTVALCKYNRIMIISPRYLARGYNWLDTLSHEYVHYVLTRKSRNHFPLWLHEGAAKYLESRWRGEKKYLNPIMETILASGLENNYLISLDQMMPSLAKLKSAEDVQLAYAQVSTMMEHIFELKGEAFLSRMLEQLATGKEEFTPMLERELGLSLAQFQEAWEVHARKMKLKNIPGHKTLLLQFKKDGESEDETSYRQIQEKRTRDLTFLADVLKSRNYMEAAVVEYEKAVKETESLNPILYNKLAAAYLSSGDPEKAELLLQKSLEFYPMFSTTLVNLANVYLQTNDRPKAQSYLEQALRINPFNPYVHLQLIQTYQSLGLPDKKRLQETLYSYIE